MDIVIKGHLTGLRKATLLSGKPLADCPKSYQKIEVVRHSIGNAYNSDIATLYQAKSGPVLEIYRDGCFYPYYCPIVLGEFITAK